MVPKNTSSSPTKKLVKPKVYTFDPPRLCSLPRALGAGIHHFPLKAYTNCANGSSLLGASLPRGPSIVTHGPVNHRL